MAVKDMCSNETRKKNTDLFLSSSNTESHKMTEYVIPTFWTHLTSAFSVVLNPF